jgi:alpha-N-acetylglucosamine transferase
VENMKKYAYITVVTTEEYLKGAICLQESLRAVKSEYPLLVLVTNNLKDSPHLQHLDLYKFVPLLKFEISCGPNAFRYFDTINKFHIFKETEYDTVCWLDSDMIIYSNLDFLFTKYEGKPFVFKLYANRWERYFAIEGNIFLLKPMGEEYFNEHVHDWVKEWANDEDVFNFEIFQELKSEAVMFERSDYRNRFFHGVGKLKYFGAFKNGEEIKQLFRQKTPKEIANTLDAWYRANYDQVCDNT